MLIKSTASRKNIMILVIGNESWKIRRPKEKEAARGHEVHPTHFPLTTHHYWDQQTAPDVVTWLRQCPRARVTGYHVRVTWRYPLLARKQLPCSDWWIARPAQLLLVHHKEDIGLKKWRALQGGVILMRVALALLCLLSPQAAGQDEN